MQLNYDLSSTYAEPRETDRRGCWQDHFSGYFSQLLMWLFNILVGKYLKSNVQRMFGQLYLICLTELASNTEPAISCSRPTTQLQPWKHKHPIMYHCKTQMAFVKTNAEHLHSKQHLLCIYNVPNHASCKTFIQSTWATATDWGKKLLVMNCSVWPRTTNRILQTLTYQCLEYTFFICCRQSISLDTVTSANLNDQLDCTPQNMKNEIKHISRLLKKQITESTPTRCGKSFREAVVINGIQR
jgi:hypothetical protein